MSVITCSFSRGAAPLLQMKLDLDSERPNERSILGYLQTGASFEPDVASVFVRLLREGDVVVDVGANVGYLTTLAAMLVGRTGRVVAFEPGPENLARLRANLALNDCANVTVIEKVVTNQVGDVEFFINSDDSGGNALWDPAQYPGNAKCLATPIRLTVPGTTLDAELEQLRLAPKLIKIDTEGAEQRVCWRACAASSRRRNCVLSLRSCTTSGSPSWAAASKACAASSRGWVIRPSL